MTGFDLSSFSFYGFFPRDNMPRKKLMNQIKQDSQVPTVVFYESPKRIISTVSFFVEENIDCQLCLCNDLTKFYEYMYRGTPAEVLEELNMRGTAEKGEYVIVAEMNRSRDDRLAAEQLSPEALLVEMIVKDGCSMKEAVKRLADDPDNGYSKNALYEAGLRLKELF